MAVLNTLGRKLWDLDRFGLSPRKLALRLPAAGRSARPIFISSVPKSGTHLLERVICLQPRFYRPLVRTLNEVNVPSYGGWRTVLGEPRGGAVFVTHAYFGDEIEQTINAADYAKFLMVRDPRAMVLSFAHHVTDPAHPKYEYVRGMDLHQRVDFALEAKVFARGATYTDTINWFLGWREAKSLLVCRFEELVGPPEAARTAIENILLHAGLAPDAATLDATCDQFRSNKSPTFRRGTTDEWKSVLRPDQIARIESQCREFLAAFDYLPGTRAGQSDGSSYNGLT